MLEMICERRGERASIVIFTRERVLQRQWRQSTREQISDAPAR
jgi:hypothetical protein